MFIDVPGARLYTERVGEGPPVLMISGSGNALAGGMRPATMPFSQHFDVLGYDHRGLGESESDEPEPTMEDFARDALALADAVGWDRFGVVGLSFGGMVAQHVAIMAPERIQSLVLGCTSSGGAGGSSYPLHDRPDEQKRLEISDTRPEMQELLRQALANLPHVEPAEPGYTRQLEARRHHDVYDRLPLITAPTYIGSGRYDGIAPVANCQAIADQIPGAVHEIFEGGHPFPMQDPAAWPAMIAFLQRTMQ